MRIPVTLGEGRWGWAPDFSLDEVNLTLLCLLSHDFNTIKEIVARKLNIDTLSRVADENQINTPEERRKIHRRRIINKALAMELLIALLLTWLDDSDQVGSNCCINHLGLPNNHAPKLVSDIEAEYPACDDGPAFRVLCEVSIKRRPTASDYRDQLDKTLTHAKDTSKDDDERPVYGLVINGGDIATDNALHAVYKRFLADNRLMRDGKIRVIPLCTVDFAGVMLNLVEDEAYDFRSSVLARVFDTLSEKLRQESLPTKEDWMETVFLNTIDADRFPELDLKEQESSDKGDEVSEDEPAESAEDKPEDDSKLK